MSDELLQTEGRVLHDRASRGETLSEPEQARLDAYYAMVEATFPLRTSEDELLRMEERNRQLQSFVAREEHFLTRLRELYTEHQALNTERKRVLAH